MEKALWVHRDPEVIQREKNVKKRKKEERSTHNRRKPPITRLLLVLWRRTTLNKRSSCVCGGERGEGDLACFPTISEEAEAIDGDEGARCRDKGEKGGLDATSWGARVQGMGPGLGKGGVSRSGEGAGAGAGSQHQGAEVLTNLSRFDA